MRSTRPAAARAFVGAATALLLAVVAASVLTAGGDAAPQAPTVIRGAQQSAEVKPAKLDLDLGKLARIAPDPARGKGVVRKLGTLDAGAAAAASTPDWARAWGHTATRALTRTTLAVTPTAFSASFNFPGINYTQFVPPDTQGDVGPNHYVQVVNASFAIWDKQGNLLAGPTNINQLWIAAGAGTANGCQQNRGDPIAMYDHLADRWVISQFAVGADGGFGGTDNSECIAVSQGANPVTSGWFLYEFPMAFGHDYPKLAVWPDGYYMSSQQGYPGGGLNAVVFDRASMLNGAPATFQRLTAASPAVTFLPGDLEGPAPPDGTPNFFARMFDGGLWGGNDRVEVWAFTTDWGNPANSTFAQVATLNTAPFDSDLCNGNNLFNNCVPQPGTGTVLSTLSVWPMFPLRYRNFGTHEVLTFNHTVDADGADHAGIRWYELRRPPAGAWTIRQEGTYAPDAGAAGMADDLHRWMGGVAMDKAGNMALGFSVSSATVNPGIAYTGRRASDPLDLMPAGEFTMATGQGVQISNGTRWGDYSSMSVDPVDGCTFWYTQEFIGNLALAPPNLGNAWSTRIGSFRYPDCNQADLHVTKSDSPDPVLAGEQLTYTVTVRNDGPDTAFGVTLTDTFPVGLVHQSNSLGCPVAANVITCDLGDIPDGESRTLTIVLRVPHDFVAGTGGLRIVTNTATATSDWTDPDPGDNTATESTTVGELADLRVTKLCKPDTPLPAGGTAFCMIFVDNLGPSTARDVVVTDTLLGSGPFTIGTITPSQGSCSVLGTTITCNLGNLHPATLTTSGRATITVEFSATEAGDINDIATATSPTPDPDLSNNSATGSVSVTAVADLALTKTDAPDPLAAGRTITYSLSVRNDGPSTAVNVVVEDVVGAGQTLVSASAPGGSCNLGVPGDPLQPTTCNFDSIAPTVTRNMTIVVTIGDGVLPVAQNDARVSSDTFDPNNANDLAHTTTQIQIADLEILKTSDFDVYKPSSTVQYRIVVTNRGPAPALNVVVTDNLPDVKQAVYLSDTAACTKAGLVLTCDLGTIAPQTEKTFNVYVRIKGNKGSVTNSASVASTSPDPGPAPNSSTRVILIKGGV